MSQPHPRPAAAAAVATERYEPRLAAAGSTAERIELTARWILDDFDDFYAEFCRVPERAKAAFERRDPGTTVQLSRMRLSLYSVRIQELGTALRRVFPEVAEHEGLWRSIEQRYLPRIEGRYEADLTFAYFHSVRRKIYQGEWKPVEYSFGDSATAAPGSSAGIYRSFRGGACVSPRTVREILDIPGFSVSCRDAAGDAALVAERVNRVLHLDGSDRGAIRSVDVIDAGFYRNRGAYIVGRVCLRGRRIVPLILALLNDDDGIYVDAVLTEETDAHNLFSSTLANFHVTNPYYHELCGFLQSLMPQRPLGLHYTTIGFNHFGKVAVMNELRDELSATGEVFATSVGFRGTVAIGFQAPSSDYNLKVIRDRPTEQYKWGEFEGIDGVLKKYGRVHEINRTGSMLDNIIYYNLKLDREWFDPALLEELLADASESVSLQGDAVVLKYLIVQRKVTPLPVFLESASREDAEQAIINLGHCIKNNAAANIFNKDLDSRNYGVSRFMKVYLFDYDALEPFTEVKIRTNEDRVEGEEDMPDWFYEGGVIFLPEEILANLRFSDRALHDHFLAAHGDLLTVRYWERMQEKLREGGIPAISVYPEERRLRRGGGDA